MNHKRTRTPILQSIILINKIAEITDAIANNTVLRNFTITSVRAEVARIYFWAIRPAKSFSKKPVE